MKSKITEIKEKASKIIGDKKINTLINESNLMEKIQDIIENVNESNYNMYNDELEEIETYLKNKEKTLTKQSDMEFLYNLAKELREQQVRITDTNIPPLFVITNDLGENIYFLTRKSLENYSNCNLTDKKKVVKIPSDRSTELTELLEIIKRNF